MTTRILDPIKNPEALFDAIKLLSLEQCVAFPTETVYGLGANGLSSKAAQAIFKAKGRPADNPLILHIAHEHWLHEIAETRHEALQILIQNFWPGPLTLVLPKKSCVPPEVSAGLSTVAVRLPAHGLALKLIESCGFPLAAPSANRSGRPSPTSAAMVFKDLKGIIPLILDGGFCEKGLESTVLDLSSETPRILRPGSITYEALSPFIPRLQKPRALTAEKKALAPGMKYRHYRPETSVAAVADRQGLMQALEAYQPSNPALLSLSIPPVPGVLFIQYASAEELAKDLYHRFVELETLGHDLIIVEKSAEEGVGLALLNRLLKAAEREF